MINSRKKGFTIVELVIVIAVIAILAAVLIPTFSNLVKKANMSADQQAVRQMNTALAIADAKKELDVFADAQIALDNAGYNALDSLVPVSTGYKFYWIGEKDCVVLVDKDNKITFPENLCDYDLGKAISDGSATNLKNAAAEIKATVSDEATLAEAIKKGQEITLTSNVVISTAIVITSDTIINLDGNKISSPETGRPFELSNGVTLTINAEGSEVNCGQYGLVNVISGANANLVINGGTFNADTDNGSFIKLRQGKGNVNITLNNVNYVDNSDDGFVLNSAGFAGAVKITINGGSFKAFAGFQFKGDSTIKDATIEVESVAIEANGNATVENCVITVGDSSIGTAPSACVAASSNGVVTVNGGTMSADADVFWIYSTGGTITAKGVNITKGNEKAGTEYGTITIE